MRSFRVISLGQCFALDNVMYIKLRIQHQHCEYSTSRLSSQHSHWHEHISPAIISYTGVFLFDDLRGWWLNYSNSYPARCTCGPFMLCCTAAGVTSLLHLVWFVWQKKIHLVYWPSIRDNAFETLSPKMSLRNNLICDICARRPNCCVVKLSRDLHREWYPIQMMSKLTGAQLVYCSLYNDCLKGNIIRKERKCQQENHRISICAPASVSIFLIASRSSFFTPSFITTGAFSTRSFAC